MGKKKNPKVDALFAKSERWRDEKEKLRSILLALPLAEEMKWGKACYTFEGGNVVLIFGLKDYFALGFLKGSLLQDPKKILVAPGKNSQAMRQIRFTSAGEITKLKPTIRAYVKEAIELEQAGKKVDFKAKEVLELPEELEKMLEKKPDFREAFEALTPGRRRGYVLHFSSAKQSKTRTARIERCMDKIFAGVGLNERPAAKAKGNHPA